MMMKPAHILASCIALLAMPLAQASCASDDPSVVAKAFYAKNADFYFGNPSKLKSILAPRLFSALQRDYQCAQGEICAQESVPWTSAQDGEVGKPIKFETLENNGTQASIKMSYTFVLSKTQRSPKSATLQFQRASKDACWLFSDLISPDGNSLLSHLEAWHKEFGKGR
jgi:hypothetical protein